MATNTQEQPWFLQSSAPVFVPANDALTCSQSEFDEYVIVELRNRHEKSDELTDAMDVAGADDATTESEAFTLVTDSTSAEIKSVLKDMKLEAESQKGEEQQSDAMEVDNKTVSESPFIQGLLDHDKEEVEAPNMENKMLTENGDIAFRSTTDALVDLFSELEDVVSGPRLRELLEAAWANNPQMSLKIIFNARSIHLGKSSRTTFYRAAGWLAENHPHTLIANLRWLTRPVIEKKQKKEEAGDEDMVVVEKDEVEKDEAEEFDVKHGVSHGYWKDLLNILAIAVNGKLGVLSDPSDVLNTGNPRTIGGKKVPSAKRALEMPTNRRRARGRGVLVDAITISGRGNTKTTKVRTQVPKPDPQHDKKASMEAKKNRKKTRDDRHARAVKTFEENAVYRVMHLAVARLFAEQLERDLAKFNSVDPKARKTISLCAKWAPSSGLFHDKHTFVTSSIAEIMHPRESLDHVLTATDDRATYLRHAREAYRQDVSLLRKHLEVVERDISAHDFANIKYDRVPSIAMKNYTPLFVKKDMEHFESYLDRVASGKANISGAVLLPSIMVKEALEGGDGLDDYRASHMSAKQILDQRIREQKMRAANGQWNTMVKRIKDSGTMSSSIAVCDVSGSMYSPRFKDGTCPLHTAIGLSLLVAEVTEAPFGGCIIDFSDEPRVNHVDLRKTLQEKVRDLKGINMGFNTDFVATFEKLILPMAIKKRLTQEQMVKRVFVFSDMQFDEADRSHNRHSKHKSWDSSYEKIKKSYAKAGYEMPELIFWNLAGGRAGYNYGGAFEGDPVAPKPVTAGEKGTSLVSGYSQGLLKVFLDNGGFEDLEDEEDDADGGDKDDGKEAGDGESDGDKAKSKSKMDPLRTVKRAVGHNAYEMLQVYD